MYTKLKCLADPLINDFLFGISAMYRVVKHLPKDLQSILLTIITITGN